MPATFTPDPPAPPDDGARRTFPAVAGWVLYDFANTIFSFVIITRYFNPYIQELTGSELPFAAVTLGSMLAAGLLVPFLGAVADRTGRIRRLLVGSTLCWELIRSGTARRLLGRVRLVVGGSCWWTLPDGDNGDSPFRAANLAMARTAAPRLARMLGVPVVHGAHAGPFNGFYSPELPDVAYDFSYLGEAMIVDARGAVLARRPAAEGAGVAVADIDLTAAAMPLDPVPERFWIPEEMPEPWKASWERWFGKGGHYYAAVTEPFLRTGEVNEYVPEYLL